MESVASLARLEAETQASGLDEKVATNNLASKHQDRALAIEPADGLGGRQRAVRMSSGV